MPSEGLTLLKPEFLPHALVCQLSAEGALEAQGRTLTQASQKTKRIRATPERADRILISLSMGVFWVPVHTAGEDEQDIIPKVSKRSIR